jgi:hypothetical protein
MASSPILNEIAKKIIQEQEQLMGPVAWYEAGKVKGFKTLDQKSGNVAIEENTDGKVVVDNLINQYGNLFGRAALEVCKEAVTALAAELSPSELPSSLK